jgi:HSP20 family protein
MARTHNDTKEAKMAVPVRWDAVREVEDLHDRMNQLLQGAGIDTNGVWSPLVDVEETEDAWIVEAELPGVKKHDVNVEMRDNELVISGEMKERERKGILRRRTRRTGRFDYRVTLPGDADAANIEASLHDGILTVRVPKPERTRPRRIEVNDQ